MAVAGSITFTQTQVTSSKPIGTWGPMFSILCDWTSDASGVVAEIPVLPKAAALVQAVFVPDSGGTQPTDLYDMTIRQENGLDVLNGEGANLSNATPKVSRFSPPVITSGQLFPTLANAGNAKGGTVTLWFVQPS